eukprot:GHVH01011652.1.p1 GENE.GHVH01011652.1~~GHVH01011652.1.p1  ORF type:complete len:250 (+),score=36.11 GHVH01011652.1:340-1089(+)
MNSIIQMVFTLVPLMATSVAVGHPTDHFLNPNNRRRESLLDDVTVDQDAFMSAAPLQRRLSRLNVYENSGALATSRETEERQQREQQQREQQQRERQQEEAGHVKGPDMKSKEHSQRNAPPKLRDGGRVYRQSADVSRQDKNGLLMKPKLRRQNSRINETFASPEEKAQKVAEERMREMHREDDARLAQFIESNRDDFIEYKPGERILLRPKEGPVIKLLTNNIVHKEKAKMSEMGRSRRSSVFLARLL